MHCLRLRKPDGRELNLYSRRPIAPVREAPSPFPAPLNARPHLRWHPLRGEWVTYAAYRQGRTFQPPPRYNPLAPTTDPASPTELPPGDWEVAVFDNRFPALMPPEGKCEVVVFSQDPHTPLGELSLGHIELVLEVWGERTAELGSLEHVQYVLPFENRGAEVGGTLPHPHGQLYAYPVVPPMPARMLETAREGDGLLRRMIEEEMSQGERVLYAGPHAIAFIPVCARYPYEVWVAPIEPVPDFTRLRDAQRRDLARALKTVLLKYDGLWQRPFPYCMVWYQAPTDGRPHPEAHLHAQFYPPYRTPDRLKYLAGAELGGGMFTMDALPEEKARELQKVEVLLEA